MNVKEIFKTKESRINFLAGLVRLSKADGNFDEDEKEFFRNSAAALGLDHEGVQLLDLYSSQEIIPVSFETKTESLYFFQQAIQLCNIDGDYADSEKEEIQKLREELNISKESIIRIEEWVDEGIRWLKEGENLLHLE